MTLLWFCSGASLVIAILALAQARRASRRLEQLLQNYWELKFQNGELRVQLQQLAGTAPPSSPPSQPAAAGRDSFVPLASLKR
jgi:hypothetical protein